MALAEMPEEAVKRLMELLPASLRGNLTPAEQELLKKAPRGEELDCTTGNPERDKPTSWTSWDPKRTIRAEVLRILTTHPGTMELVHYRGIGIRGVRIDGTLDLEGATILHRLYIRESAIPQGITLTDAKTRTLVLDGSLIGAFRGENLHVDGDLSFARAVVHGGVNLRGAAIEGELSCRGGRFENPGGEALFADRVTVKGDVFLDDGFQAMGEVRLLGAAIEGQLVCTRGRFENPEGDALSADEVAVRGNVFLDEGFHARGEVRLLGAAIEGQLSCRGGRFENPGGKALSADGATVKRGVFLDEGFHAMGEIRLPGAAIEGPLSCRGGEFENPEGIAFLADGATVKRGVFLDEGFHARGVVRLLGAAIEGQLVCTRGRFENPGGDALVLQGATVKDTAFLSDLKIEGVLSLAYASVRILQDDEGSWPKREQLYLEGFKYQGLAGENTPRDAKKRLEWLRRQPEFFPGTYDQLASVFRQMGLEDEAVQVMMAKQDDWIRSGTLSCGRRIWKRILGWTTGHGYQSWRSLIWLFAFFGIGFFLFRLGEWFGVFVPSSPPVLLSEAYQKSGKPPRGYPKFRPWLYSLDTLIPIVDLHQENFWLPETVGIPGWVVYVHLRIHILLGWILSTLFVASVTGLVRRIE